MNGDLVFALRDVLESPDHLQRLRPRECLMPNGPNLEVLEAQNWLFNGSEESLEQEYRYEPVIVALDDPRAPNRVPSVDLDRGHPGVGFAWIYSD
jgi:hypothetical protein